MSRQIPASPNEHAIIRNAVVPLARLHPHPRNYNQHSDEQIRRITSSLHRFGQPRSIVVWERDDDDWWILAGHGVVLGAQSAKWTEIRADILPRSYPESDALAYLIADNEIARLSEPDESALAALLREQADAGFDLASLGSSDEDLAVLLAKLGDDLLTDHMRTTELDDPAGGTLESGYSLLVTCTDEGEQQRAYDLVTGQGFTCRILTL